MSSCEYNIKIAGIQRKLPLFPINDDTQIAAFIMFGDVEITEAAAAEIAKKLPDFDLILTAESKGIPLAYELSRQTGKKYMVARKKGKLYMKNLIWTDVDSITTQGIQKLCVGEMEHIMMTGKKVVIVDDVISTGNSAAAAESLVIACGGEVCARAAVLAEGEAAKRKDIIYLEKLPLFDKNGNPLN